MFRVKFAALALFCWSALWAISCGSNLLSGWLSMQQDTFPANQGSDSFKSSRIKAAPRFYTSAQLCPAVSMEKLAPEFHSTQEEDETLLQYFNGICNGTYIEMGALDGVRSSNTFVFNKVFDWRGVLVELSPTTYKKLIKNRPNEIATVNAAVCAKERTVHWYQSKVGPLCGIWEFTTQSYRTRWWKDATFEDTVPVKCSPLQDILDKHAPYTSFFDVFSLDVEGAEYEALQSLDFEKVAFGMIVVENDNNNPRKDLAVRGLLKANGYFMLQRLGNNDIMVNNDFGEIYKDLISPVSMGDAILNRNNTASKASTLSTGGIKDSTPARHVNETLQQIAGRQCTPTCNCTNQTFYRIPLNYTLEDIFALDHVSHSMKKTTKAVCVWNGKSINKHLPHWLQIVYRCWSWWALHNATHQAVLEIPLESQSYWNEALLRSPLAEGLWIDMKEALSIVVIQQDNVTNSTQDKELRAMPIVKDTPWFPTVETAHVLRDYVVGKNFPERPLSGCKNSSAHFQYKNPLENVSIPISTQISHARIGILDRQGTRNLLNHEDIVSALQKLTSTPVLYKTFEGASYLEQIDFYSSVDILVTPHGAQMSGVPFMPSCGGVLELLPQYYHIHAFFGPLSVSSGLESSYLYLSDGDPAGEMRNAFESHEFRKKVRAVSLCPQVSSIVNSVLALLDKWESCCAET